MSYTFNLTWPLVIDPSVLYLGVYEVAGGVDVLIISGLPTSTISYSITTSVLGPHNYIIKTFNGYWVDYYSIFNVVGSVTSAYLHVPGIDLINGLFVRVYVDLFIDSNLYISTSPDGITWTNRATVATYDFSFTVGAVAFAYDGSYYYVAIKTYTLNTSVLESTDIWRSSDGITWTNVSTITRDGPYAQNGQSILEYYDGKLVYSSYHFITELVGQPTVFMVSFVYSIDHGVTWKVVQTPFYDLSPAGGIAPTS